MNQSNRGGFRSNESFFKMFRQSCLGRLVITAIVLVILAIVAYSTCPTEQYMREEMDDNIRQCIEEHDSVHVDWTEVLVMNSRYMFTKADSVVQDQEAMDLFNRYNRTEYYNHSLFSTMYIYNSFYIEGKRCGWGIFGLVIPTVNFNDFLLRLGPGLKEYERPDPNADYNSEEYFGENPDLGGVFQYNGE
jgi:hypothetical protein